MTAPQNEALTGYNVEDTRECRARAGMRGYGFWKRFRDPVAFKVADKRNPSRGNAGVSQFGGSCPGDAANRRYQVLDN